MCSHPRRCRLEGTRTSLVSMQGMRPSGQVCCHLLTCHVQTPSSCSPMIRCMPMQRQPRKMCTMSPWSVPRTHRQCNAHPCQRIKHRHRWATMRRTRLPSWLMASMQAREIMTAPRHDCRTTSPSQNDCCSPCCLRSKPNRERHVCYLSFTQQWRIPK